MFLKFIEDELPIWVKFHEYWLNQTQVPVYIVRYEDFEMSP